jgi:hypothetical protein
VAKRKEQTREQILALAAFGAITLLSLGAATTPARAAARVAVCKQWNVSGSWSTTQSNNYHVAFRFAQTGTTFTGTATLPAGEATAGGFASRTGKVTGTVRGSHLILKTVWTKTTGRAVGQYMGVVSHGKVTGSGHDITNPSAPGPSVSWSGKGPARCVRHG